MLAQRFPEAKVDAIELEPEAAQQAQDNVNRSPYADRIQVHVRAAQGWDTRVDLVVCNPPFFHGHPKSADRKRNLARHDDTLPLRTLLRTAQACLKESGEFAMVFPEDRANELIATAEEVGLHLHTKVALRATSAHDVIRSLWSWRLHPFSRTTQDTWEIEGPKGHGEWSATVQALLSPFV
jgi:tRNA1Val (adenine37-N6)-methyltransferase